MESKVDRVLQLIANQIVPNKHGFRVSCSPPFNGVMMPLYVDGNLIETQDQLDAALESWSYDCPWAAIGCEHAANCEIRGDRSKAEECKQYHF